MKTQLAKQNTLHVSFGQGEQFLYEWVKSHADETPFTISGLVKRMILNDYRRVQHSTKKNLYPINTQATGF